MARGEVDKPPSIRDQADAPPLPLGGELEQVVYEAEVVADEATVVRVRLGGRTIAVRPSPGAVTAGRWVAGAVLAVVQGWHSWAVRAWDAGTWGVYRRQIRAAEGVGDREAIAAWVERKDVAVDRRRARLMTLPRLALGLAKLAIWSLVALLVVLILTSTVVWAVGAGDFPDVWIWAASVLRWLIGAVRLAWIAFLVSLPPLLLVAGWREGRRRGTAPKWLRTAADFDVDIAIDETTVARALEALRIPQITSYLKQGLPLQYLTPARKDGRGTHAVLRLPAGVTAERIGRRRADLATGLHRLAKEVWPTTGSEAGILDLWVADKGALVEGAGPYPLIAGGTVDVFRGAPLGKTLRGDPMLAPLMERNTIAGGMPGQGKSSSARVIMAGAALDPTAELRIFVPDTNFDFELFKRRCSRYVMGAEDDKIEQILWELRDLAAEVQSRGQILIDHEEPAVTRKLADAGIGLHPLFALLEEAHLAIQHKEFGDEIAQLLCDIVKLGRKRGIHLIVSTQAPTKDSMPRDVTRNCSNGIAFAVGDHVANDALLGQGAYSAGHRATELIPGTDKGTAVCKGLTGERSDIVQVYFISIAKGADELTPIIDRSLEAIVQRGTGVPGVGGPPRQIESRDLLADVSEVIGEERIRLSDVPGLLRQLAPNWGPYEDLTGIQLRKMLIREAVRVTNAGNVPRLDPDDLRQALAERDAGE